MKVRFGLGPFLIFCVVLALFGAVGIQFAFDPKPAQSASAVITNDPSAPDAYVNIITSRGLNSPQIVRVIVRHRPQPFMAGPTGGPSLDFSSRSASYHRPAPQGISVRGTDVFVDGRKWPISQPCSFLVFDPTTRCLHEIPFQHQGGAPSADDITGNAVWKSDVMPLLRRIYADLRAYNSHD